MNFSRRKRGQAHDNFAESENVTGAREPSVHAHFIFRFENGQGNQNLFSTHDDEIQLKRVNHKLRRQMVDAPSTGRFREASSGPEKLKFGSARLSRKKGNFVDRRMLLFRGFKFKETKHDRLERDLQQPRLRRSTIDRRRRTWTPSACRSIELFFFFLFIRRPPTNLDLRFLLWK